MSAPTRRPAPTLRPAGPSPASPSRPRGPEPVWWLSIRGLDLFMRVAGRLDVHGAARLPDGPALLVANHVSWLDPIGLLVAVHRSNGRKIRFVALPSLFRAPVVGWFLRAGRHIPAYGGGQARATLRGVLDATERGELVLVYPEGGIPEPGQEVEAPAGLGVLLRRVQAPVIPIVTVGLERRRYWCLTRRRAAVLVGAPLALPPNGAAATSAQQAQQALDAVRALGEELDLLHHPDTSVLADRGLC